MPARVLSPSTTTSYVHVDGDVFGDGRAFEVVLDLPGVTSARDVSADVVDARSAYGVSTSRALAVRASANALDGGEDVEYLASVTLPADVRCDASSPRVKFNARRARLAVTFDAADEDARAMTSETDAKEGCAADEADEDNPLAEYLAMLGVNEDGTPRASAVAAAHDDANAAAAAEDDANAAAAAEDDANAPTASTSTTTIRPAAGAHARGDPVTTRSSSSRALDRRTTNPKKTKRKSHPRPRLAPLRCVRTARTVQAVSDLADHLTEGLNAVGWATAPFMTSDAVALAREEIKNVAPFYTPGEVWLGKSSATGAQIAVKSIRGDRIFWMVPEQIEMGGFVVFREMLRAIDDLVLDQLSRRAPARLGGLSDRTHAMLAEYPGRGSRFVRHVDNTGKDGRRLTVLCYLNEDWDGKNGGHLKVYDRDGNGDGDGDRGGGRVTSVTPAGGTLAMFYSDEIPHEVLPSHATRHSFTVWYYDDDEHKAATSRAGDAAVADSRTTHAPATSTSDARNLGADRQTCADLDLDEQRQDISDRAATAFVRTLMTERVTPAEATALAARLDPRASVAVASVFGAPDVEVRPTHRSPCDRVRAVHAVP
ncbi:uncharacterized protein MICPUCDRAFT_38436 [Micromonas pusilla CCMP1545]|uniref:Predicted protein n=1 Tax=Micromonas pusilla (strain CCMP1545) TaxID=564608 RepID=C1MK90_MICPC|nr:uncharacterized protein MICPUCDRAFT_38436 [Micromonas pusilla CCMP1545]EEH59331.1 predicted protein [Micromonas pusilla CCMP1545]|eukprot:XP_003055955.1 predicted protein [Micromonas pusilla CCMP1545]